MKMLSNRHRSRAAARHARSRHRRRRRAAGRWRRPLRRHHRRLARQFLHRQLDRAEAGADRRALRAARRGLQDRRVRRRRHAAIAERARPSRSIPASTCRRCWRIAPPPTWRCCSWNIPLKGKSTAPRRHATAFRSVGSRFTIAGIGVTVRGDGKSGGTMRVAGLVATGKPGTLADPPGRSGDEGCARRAWRLHRRFRRAGVRGQAERPPSSSASSAGRPGRTAAAGCGG